jgi:GT2 family glycosyltransferase
MTDSAPDLSVILVNWNTADLLIRALESLQADALSSGIALELVVSDNGSRDDSVARARSAFPRAKVLENGHNLGFARAVNRGLAVATGRHVLLFNTDARIEPGGLASALDTLAHHPEIGVLGAALMHADGSPQNVLAPFPSLATELVNKSLLRKLHPAKYRQKVGAQETDLVEGDTIVGAFLLIRGEALAKVGPLDERFFFFFEETDWCYRVQQAGFRVAVDPRVRVFHGQGESSRPVLSETRIEYYRSRYRYFQKHFRSFRTVILFEALLLKLNIEVLSALVMNLLSLGRSPRWKNRLRVVAILLAWHIRGCPRSWGLEGKFLPADRRGADREGKSD